MRSFAPRPLILLAAAAGTFLTGCQAVPSPTPSPTPSATPTACPTPYAREQWGSIVLYETSTGCRQFAGPPRIGVRRGETITWRIYSKCRTKHTVEIGDIRKSPDDKGFAAAKSWKDFDDFKKTRKGYPADDPFEAGDRKKEVPAHGIEDLTLKVKANLACDRNDAEPEERCGLYTYVAFLDGKPDEGDIDIWP